MVFDDPNHTFFVLHQNEEVVSLCNYSTDEETKIAHIGIITPKQFCGNGYATILVNSVVQNILESDLVPQYRAEWSNNASLGIAKSLGFTPVIESFSFVGE